MLEMMRWCMDEPIDAGYAPMMREDLGLIAATSSGARAARRADAIATS